MTKNGMLLALIEEYKRASLELKHILTNLSQESFEKITDENTKDPDCKSIQSITIHVIQSGYTYANYINAANNKVWYEYTKSVETPNKGISEINNMLDFTEQSFDSLWYKTNEEIEKLKFNTRWNVTYDFEQLIEHAIVHILRHRRQIENIIKN